AGIVEAPPEEAPVRRRNRDRLVVPPRPVEPGHVGAVDPGMAPSDPRIALGPKNEPRHGVRLSLPRPCGNTAQEGLEGRPSTPYEARRTVIITSAAALFSRGRLRLKLENHPQSSQPPASWTSVRSSCGKTMRVGWRWTTSRCRPFSLMSN